MGVITLRRARGWTIVKDDGDALSITQDEAKALRQLLDNELASQADSKPYSTATPAQARWE